MDTQTALERAALAARHKDELHARLILGEILKREPHNEAAWLLLAVVAEKDEHALYCLERARRINLDNVTAQQELASLRKPLETVQDNVEASGTPEKIVGDSKFPMPLVAPPAPPTAQRNSPQFGILASVSKATTSRAGLASLIVGGVALAACCCLCALLLISSQDSNQVAPAPTQSPATATAGASTATSTLLPQPTRTLTPALPTPTLTNTPIPATAVEVTITPSATHEPAATETPIAVDAYGIRIGTTADDLLVVRGEPRDIEVMGNDENGLVVMWTYYENGDYTFYTLRHWELNGVTAYRVSKITK